jgi:hypothetical protein
MGVVAGGSDQIQASPRLASVRGTFETGHEEAGESRIWYHLARPTQPIARQQS